MQSHRTPRHQPERKTQVFNVSFETWLIGMNSTYFTFEPRSLTEIPDKYIWIIEAEYSDRGLVVIYPGDNLKEKECEGLASYLRLLENRITNFQLELDERKKRGVTILEQPKAMIKAIQWKEEIIDKLRMEKKEEIIPSFKDETPEKFSKIFDGFDGAKVEALKPLLQSKNGKKATSFAEVDLSKEVAN